MSAYQNYESTRSKLESITIGLLLFLVLWSPLPLGSNRDWSLSLMIMLIGFAAITWSLVLIRNQNQHSIAHHAIPMLILLALAQLWVAAQWLLDLTSNPGATFQYLMLGIAYSLLFFLIISVFNTRKRLIWLISALVVSGTFQAFYGTSMVLTQVEWLITGPKEASVGSASGTFVNRNHFAGYIQMTIALGIGLMLALREVKNFSWVNTLELLLSEKVLIRLAVVIMVIGLVMSHSRMGNTAFVFSLVTIGLVYILINKEKRLRNIIILASFIIIDLLIISQYFGLERLKDRLMSTEVTITQEHGTLVFDINDLRGLALKNGLPLAMEKPLVGQGAGSYEVTFIGHAGPEFGGHFDHAHNDYLEFWIERGLIGVIPLTLFVLMALFFSLKAMIKGQSHFRKGLGFGASMGILSILIHSATDFNLHIPANAQLFVITCAIAYLAYHHKSPTRSHHRQH